MLGAVPSLSNNGVQESHPPRVDHLQVPQQMASRFPTPDSILPTASISDLVKQYESQELRDYVYLKLARMMLKKWEQSTDNFNIGQLGELIFRISKRFNCSPITILLCAYLILQRTPVEREFFHNISPECPSRALIKIFFAAMMISITVHECRLELGSTGDVTCACHSERCAYRETWFAMSSDIYDSLNELCRMEAKLFDGALDGKRFPPQAYELDYFVERCLTSKKCMSEQLVPGNDLYYIINCLE